MTDEKKPTIIKEFPGAAVERHLRATGHLPNEDCKCGDYERVQGQKTTVGKASVHVIDRTRPFDGKCELCGKKDDLRPYGAKCEWICFDCGMKNKEMTDKRLGQVLFGDNPDA